MSHETGVELPHFMDLNIPILKLIQYGMSTVMSERKERRKKEKEGKGKEGKEGKGKQEREGGKEGGSKKRKERICARNSVAVKSMGGPFRPQLITCPHQWPRPHRHHPWFER